MFSVQLYNSDVDFEEKYIEETRKQHQVETGPMWRVTVFPLQTVFDEEAAASGFKYQYQLLLGMHHSITDGHSSMRICGHLLRLLNDVIDGNTIDDEKQLGEFVNDEHNQKVTDEVKKQLKEDPSMYAGVKKRLQEYSEFTPLYFIPYDPSKTSETDSIAVNIPRVTTSKFIANAKAAGVTVHSAFCTVVHVAIVDILLSKGFKCDDHSDCFRITSNQDVDARRYYEGETDSMFGVHICVFRTVQSIPKDTKTKFWHSAQTFHAKFLSELENKEGYKLTIVEEDETTPPKNLTEFLEQWAKSPFLLRNIKYGKCHEVF